MPEESGGVLEPIGGGMDSFALNQSTVISVTLYIPPGVYIAAEWTLQADYTLTATENIEAAIGLDAVLMGAVNSPGGSNVVRTKAASANQLSLINLAAGGYITVTLSMTGSGISDTVNVDSFTVTLTSEGGDSMPATINPTNALWWKGFLFGTKQAGVVDDIPFGELQEISLNDDMEFAKLFGPSSMLAIGVGARQRNVSGSARHAKIRARQFNMLRNAGVAHSGGVTTVTANIVDEPTVFNLHALSPANGVDAELKLYGCVAPSLGLQFQMNDWVIPNFGFEAFGDGTKVYELLLAGNQTTS